jgi:hypothetical protein
MSIHHELGESGTKPMTMWQGMAKRARRAVMAFIRKRGNIYYLVHNLREQGRVRQLHLARLGRRARLNDEVIAEVMAKHPFVRVDWKRLREEASAQRLQPLKDDLLYLRSLLSTIHNVHLEIGDLHLPELYTTPDRELRSQLTSELKLLQGTLNLKLREIGTRKSSRGEAKPRSVNL